MVVPVKAQGIRVGLRLEVGVYLVEIFVITAGIGQQVRIEPCGYEFCGKLEALGRTVAPGGIDYPGEVTVDVRRPEWLLAGRDGRDQIVVDGRGVEPLADGREIVASYKAGGCSYLVERECYGVVVEIVLSKTPADLSAYILEGLGDAEGIYYNVVQHLVEIGVAKACQIGGVGDIEVIEGLVI